MRMKEQRLWDTMRRKKPCGFGKLERVENGVGSGMPDVYCVPAHGTDECWVELKAPIAPKRRQTRVLGGEGLNPAQVNWHLEHAGLGARSFILIRDNLGRLWLIDGNMAHEANEMDAAALNENAIARDWPTIFKALGGEI